MFEVPTFFKTNNVAQSLQKRSLLIAVNAVAGLSIFFFGISHLCLNQTRSVPELTDLGYDQGVMGGVNTARDYAETMGFGHWDEQKGLVVVDHSLLQGGIVWSTSCIFPHVLTHDRLRCTISQERLLVL